MRFYLTGLPSRQEELKTVRAELLQMGHMVVSRWLDATQHTESGIGGIPPLELMSQEACRDMSDIDNADVTISFTESRGFGPMHSSRHVALGYALGSDKKVWVVGFHENIFTTLPRVKYFPTWGALKLKLMTGVLT